jgi:hypothetical protein
MRYTAVRCYVLLDLVEPGKLTITRNGALEPRIKDFKASEHPFSEKRLLTAVADLHNESMIQFKGRGFHGVYQGEAEVAPVGCNRLHLVRRAQQELAEKAERDAAEREKFKERQAEQQAAFKEANQVLKSDVTQEAAERVEAFLGQWSKMANAHPEDVYVLQTLDHDADELVSLPLRVSDLTALLDAVKGKRS